MKDETNEMLAANVRDIANELEAIANGSLYEDEKGEYVVIDDMDEWRESHEDSDEPESVDIYGYMDRRALSVECWKIDRDGDCVGGEIQFCVGGPTVWATEDGVFGVWGSNHYDYYSSEAGNVVLEYLEETMPSR